MASGGRAKKFRGNHTHGRGKKAGRGAGLRGGRGRAGANKHRFLMLQILGGKHAHTAARPWGRTGFKYRSRNGNEQPETLNVSDLAMRFPGQAEVDLTAAGFGKLLGAGTLAHKVTVRVASASSSAVQKVQAAGGQVVLPEGVAPPPEAAPKADAKGGASKGDKAAPKGDKPAKADKPAKGDGKADAKGGAPKGDKPAKGADKGGDKAAGPKGDKPAGKPPK